MSGLESQLLALLLFLASASVLAVATQRWLRASYTVALAIVGLAFGTLGVTAPVELSDDLVIFVLLPAPLFEWAASIDYHETEKVLPTVVAVALVGLAISVGAIGLIDAALVDFPLAVALLFGVIVMPTDPVAVIAVLDAVGTPEGLATLVEGESLFNDGPSIVLYTSLLGMVLNGVEPGEFLTLSRWLSLAADVAVSVFGGVAVGALAGFLIYQVVRRLDEPFSETLLTFVLAYGSFFVAEALLHASDAIATAAALVMGNWGSEDAMTVPPRRECSTRGRRSRSSSTRSSSSRSASRRRWGCSGCTRSRSCWR
jgi:CPA1 family monovalent cation:H+ antiporter